MPLKFAQRKQQDVPTPSAAGKVNYELVSLKNEMSKLSAGMVLEIDAGSEKSVRGTKMLVTKAANQLGTPWQHWSVGSTVFAKPKVGPRRRGRKPGSAR